MDTEDLLLAVRTMGTRLTQGYGSTETLGGVTYLAPSEHNPDSKDIERRITSAGKEYTNVWVACMDEHGNFVRCREVGQIVVKGDKLFGGYWRDPEGTQKVMKDGWFMTGDLGYFDEDDYLYIVDRLSDLIITGGENVYPQEIEDLLNGFSKVADCAVIGLPDREWGEEVWAFVIPTPGMAFDAEEAVTFCKARMAGYKVPRRFVTCSDLPRNYLGKTQKFILRERAKGLKEALVGQQT
jgi:acyl-CoA synthetase (AMP-forming)/AMP-acid ligase II